MKMNRIIAAACAVLMSVSAVSLPVYAEAQMSGALVTKEDVKKLTGWQTVDGKKYYYNADGTMHTGWLTLSSGNKYYITADKGCLTGWQTIGKHKYYFRSDGVMKTGWLKSSKGRYYYMDRNGIMVTSENAPNGIKIGSKVYKFDKNGVLNGSKVKEESSSSKKSLVEQRKEAYAAVKACNAEYDRYCKLKESEFDVRDTYYDYAEFLTGYMDTDNKCKALVLYSQLSLSEVQKINTIIAGVCAENGEADIKYWKKQNDDDFYYVIYEQCIKIAKKYNSRGNAYNDEIASVVKKRNQCVDTYNSINRKIKEMNKK